MKQNRRIDFAVMIKVCNFANNDSIFPYLHIATEPKYSD